MSDTTIHQPAIVTDPALVALLHDPGRLGIVPVARRRRRRGGWHPLSADSVADALPAEGRDLLVLARPRSADPGGAALAVIGECAGAPVVRLAGDARAAAWSVGWTARLWRAGADRARALRSVEVLAGAVGAGLVDPFGTPALGGSAGLGRWAARAWRPCERCPGGGLVGAACGRCGGPVVSGGAP